MVYVRSFKWGTLARVFVDGTNADEVVLRGPKRIASSRGEESDVSYIPSSIHSDEGYRTVLVDEKRKSDRRQGRSCTRLHLDAEDTFGCGGRHLTVEIWSLRIRIHVTEYPYRLFTTGVQPLFCPMVCAPNTSAPQTSHKTPPFHTPPRNSPYALYLRLITRVKSK